MPWLALTLEVEAAHAEALGDALLETGAESVSLDNIDSPRIAVQALVGLETDAAALVANAVKHLKLKAVPSYAVSRIEDDDWVRRSQSQFAPLRIGKRLWVVPSWHEPPASGAAVVRLDPGLAFGTGGHPSTRLVLKFLEKNIRGGERVLDYGCGSGILAIAAAKLGAAVVAAVDIDPQALAAATENARRNGVALGVFSSDDVPPDRYDMVLANILAAPLIALAPLLAARTRKGGRIALSGVLAAQAGEVSAAYAGDFEIGVAATQESWVLIAGARR